MKYLYRFQPSTPPSRKLTSREQAECDLISKLSYSTCVTSLWENTSKLPVCVCCCFITQQLSFWHCSGVIHVLNDLNKWCDFKIWGNQTLWYQRWWKPANFYLSKKWFCYLPIKKFLLFLLDRFFFFASYGLSTSIFHIDYYTLHQVHLIMFVENHSKIV